MRVGLIYPNLDGAPIPHLGLAYILSAVEKEHSVRLWDMTFHTQDYRNYLLASLKEFYPQVIGFSVTSFSFHHALKLAAIIRQEYPDVLLVYGGVHPTLLPEETLQNPLVDAICIGEGEDTFNEYLRMVQGAQEPRNVAGIWYKDKTGAVIKNPLRPFREDLDALAFPNWDHWNMDQYLKSNLYFVGGIGFMFSRGCPFSCTFCSNPAIRLAIPGKFYRTRSPENVIEEIKFNQAKYGAKGFRSVAFGDATFGLDIKLMERFCQLYIQESLHNQLPWICQTRAELITEEWARLAASAGCCMVILGIESGDDYIRTEVFKRQMTREEILNATKRLRKNDIKYVTNIILGCPEETVQSLRNTFALLKLADPIYTFFSFYHPLPKTQLGESSKSNIILKEDKLNRTWNVPRIATKYINNFKLEILMLKIRLPRAYKFFAAGLKLKGLEFIFRGIKYVFLTKNPPKFSLLSPLEQGALYNYIFDRWTKKHFKSNPPGKTDSFPLKPSG